MKESALCTHSQKWMLERCYHCTYVISMCDYNIHVNFLKNTHCTHYVYCYSYTHQIGFLVDARSCVYVFVCGQGGFQECSLETSQARLTQNKWVVILAIDPMTLFSLQNNNQFSSF